jgi:hypothetical protein
MLLVKMTAAEEVTPVGTFRFTRCSRETWTVGHGFGSDVFNLPRSHNGEEILPGKTFDAGRWVAHPVETPRGSRQVLVHMLLAEAGLKLSQEMGIRHWACIINHQAARMGRHNGWPLDPVLPGPRDYFGVVSEACIIPMDDYNHNCPRLGNPVARLREVHASR